MILGGINFMRRKKQLKIFDEYYEAFIYCGNNGYTIKKVEKHHTRPGTSKNWFVHLSNGKTLKT